MSNRLPDDYVSPNARWALLLLDYPGAEYQWRDTELGEESPRMVKASELGVPADWGGDQDVCIVTIRFPDTTGLLPVDGWKDVTEELREEAKRQKCDVERVARTPELWNVLVTKTLGRALKKAGYPERMGELRAVLAWRRRLMEMSAIGASAITAGPGILALGAGNEAEADLAAMVGGDSDVSGEHIDADVVEEVPPTTDATQAQLDSLWAELDGTTRTAVIAWAKETLSVPVAHRPKYEADAVAIVEHLEAMASSPARGDYRQESLEGQPA